MDTDQKAAVAWLVTIRNSAVSEADARHAAVLLEYVKWLERGGRENDPGPMVNPTHKSKKGPMLSIRVRGPISISELPDETQD